MVISEEILLGKRSRIEYENSRRLDHRANVKKSVLDRSSKKNVFRRGESACDILECI